MPESFDGTLKLVDACLPKDSAGNFAPSEKSDVVHDLLAFLPDRMLQMNAELQKEIKGFLGWLEGYIGARVDDLSPKTKVQGYYEHDYEDFLDVLKKTNAKLAIDLGRLEPGEALRAEFEGSVSKLRPQRERIAATDSLIAYSGDSLQFIQFSFIKCSSLNLHQFPALLHEDFE